MQQKRRTAAFFLIFVLVPLSGGCSGVSTPGPREPEDKSFAGIRLRAACPDELARSLFTEASKAWAQRTGAEVIETVLYSPTGAAVPDGGSDVWILPASQLPRWASTQQLTPL